MSDIKKINDSNKLIIPADKSKNIYIYIYIMQNNDYNKYVRDNVTKMYKHSTANRAKNINYKAKSLAEQLLLMIELKKWKKQKLISLSKITKKLFLINCHSV